MSKLLLLDSNYMAHRSFHSTPLVTSYEKLTNIIYGYLNTVLMMRNLIEPDAMISVWDNGEAASWRTELFPGYKASRKFKARDTEFSTQIDDLKAILPDLGIPCLWSMQTEADDVIGYLAYKYAEAGHEVVIFSNDGDFFQLMINPNIKVYNPDRGFIKPQDHPDYGVPPKMIIAYKSLVGDASDEYQGVPRFGKKTAQKFFGKNKTTDGIFDGTADFSTISKGMAARLMHCKNEILLCRRLATIDPVKGRVDGWAWPKKNLEEFRSTCEELEFNSFLEKRWKEFELFPEGGIPSVKLPA